MEESPVYSSLFHYAGCDRFPDGNPKGVFEHVYNVLATYWSAAFFDEVERHCQAFIFAGWLVMSAFVAGGDLVITDQPGLKSVY